MLEPLVQSKPSLGGIAFKHPVNIQQEGQITSIEAYKVSKIRLIFYYIACVLSCGIMYLLSRWIIKLYIDCRSYKCRPLEADFFLITGRDKSQTIVKKEHRIIDQKLRMVMQFRLYRYYFDEDNCLFLPIETEFNGLTCKEIMDIHSNGIQNEIQQKNIFSKFGSNNTEIPDKGILKTLVDEVLSPFYIFQIFSVLLWYFANYENYATIIFLTSVISIVLTLVESRRNFKRLQDLSKFSIKLNIIRRAPKHLIMVKNGKLDVDLDAKNYLEQVDSLELLPGDLIELQDHMILPCDTILMNGQTIINESMLTGESIPVLKTPLPYSGLIYNPNDYGKQHTIFAGTLCMETKIAKKGQVPVLALVTETAFNTMKGQLIRSIMFPQENSFKFYVDSMKFVAMMAVIAVIGFCTSVPNKIKTLQNGEISTWDFISEGLDLITITVPPALPTCLQIGISIALSRLQKRKIFCICPQKVNICGKITVMCFDKTGTLTEEGLDLYGVRPVAYFPAQQKIRFLEVTNENLLASNGVTLDDFLRRKNRIEQKITPLHTMMEIMATCHGLAWVQNEMVGDPLEVKLFEATGWSLEESQEEGLLGLVQPRVKRNTIQNSQVHSAVSLETIDSSEKIGICKRYEFSSKLQRMSVIVRDLKSENLFRVHVKGSPEKLRELCIKSSIPPSFHKILDFYAQNGFRVLAVASKQIQREEVDTYQREEAEQDLIFLGLVIMQNKLKDITTGIIEQLTDANIRSIMVTGDNVLTAISVARQCQIIQPHQRVYLGDLSEKPLPNGQYRLVWRDFEQSDHKLNPNNLHPFDEMSVVEEQDENVDEDLRAESLRLKNTLTEGRIGPEEEDYTKKMPKNPSLLEEPPPKAFIQLERKLSDKTVSQAVTSTLKSLVENDECADKEEVPIWSNCVDEYVLAVSGGAFNQILQQNDPKMIQMLLDKGQVYARMRPEEKALLVKQLQENHWRKPLVGFCGDGANDCGALKGADVGVSLSQAEASIAAPFTSQIQDISCIPLILIEGRAALTTSFNCFKFMAMYSVIQFAQVTVLYLSSSNLTDNQYLYNDLITIFPLSMTLGFTQANPKLNKFVPSGSLVSLSVMASVIGQTFIIIVFQLSLYFVLRAQSWFIEDREANKEDLNDDTLQTCYENTTLFLFGNFQYIMVTIAFAVGKPFRKSFYTNIWLVMSIITLLGVDLFVLFERWTWSDQWIGLKTDVTWSGQVVSTMPMSWFYVILITAVANTLVTITYERIVVKLSLARQNKQVTPSAGQI